MKPFRSFLMLMLFFAVLMSGCHSSTNALPNTSGANEYIPVVQQAVDLYHKKTGVLPIKNKPMNTPIFIKYPIDFNRLLGGYLHRIPDNAFENGGTFIYVLIHAETDPQVKMIDLSAFQKGADLQHTVDDYISKYHAVPSGEQVGPHLYRLDFQKLKQKPQQVYSVFTLKKRDFLIDDKGKVLINYAPDIMYYIEKYHISDLSAGQDLRDILLKYTPFAPVHSLPYHWINGQLQIVQS